MSLLLILKGFTTAVVENENVSTNKESSSTKCLENQRGIHSSKTSKQKHGKYIDLTPSAQCSPEEHHYMSLINASKNKPESRLRKQRRDQRPVPPGIVFQNTHNDSKDKHDYMELMPGLRNANAGEQKTTNKSEDAIYMSLLSEKQVNEILPEPVDAEKWEILPINLSVDEELVAGKFAVISKGRVRGLNGISDEKTVAIKTLKGRN